MKLCPGVPMAIDLLVFSAEAPSPEVRVVVATLLGEPGDQRAIPRLQAFAGSDPAAEVRAAAQGALKHLGAA